MATAMETKAQKMSEVRVHVLGIKRDRERWSP